jgi:cytidylate kinase
MTELRVIAIDGSAGSGKSTLAQGLARTLDVPYVNTGAMYRALTLAALVAGIDPDDQDALAELTRGLRFSLGAGTPPELEVDGAPPPPALESGWVEEHVSQVAKHPKVRDLMRKAQRALGSPNAVVEGRDIGTVVFPDAPVKLFLTAAPATRIERRTAERGAADPAIGSALHQRDARDSIVNPFEPAPGAEVLDTGEWTVSQTLQAALAIVRARLSEVGR